MPFRREGPARQMGPRVSVGGWDWPTTARWHPGSRVWGAPPFVSLRTELLMPPLSTSLKQCSLDAFGNPNPCRLSGLVSICGEGGSAWASCAEVTTPSGSCHTGPAVPGPKFPAEAFCSQWDSQWDTGRGLGRGGIMPKLQCFGTILKSRRTRNTSQA